MILHYSCVKIKKNGQIDVDDLERLIKDTTILVSIAGVNSEIGILQPIDKISKIITQGDFRRRNYDFRRIHGNVRSARPQRSYGRRFAFE